MKNVFKKKHQQKLCKCASKPKKVAAIQLRNFLQSKRLPFTTCIPTIEKLLAAFLFKIIKF